MDIVDVLLNQKTFHCFIVLDNNEERNSWHVNKRSKPEDSGFPPSWKCGVLVQSCSQSARNKDRHHTGEPETNMSLREEMSQRAEMWREKASRQHNHTFSRGGLTLGGLSICLSATLLWLQDDEGALVQVYAQSSLNNHTELIIDGSAYQTVSKLHLHLARPRQQPERPYTHTHSHEPDNPFTGLDPWTLGSSFTCYDSIHAPEAVSPAADCSAYLLARFPRSELRPPAWRTITL